MNGRMNGRTDGWSGTSVPAWDKRLSAMSHNVPRTKRDKRPHMGQTRRAGFRPMSAATVRRLSVIPPPSPHIDTLYATKRRNVKNIFSFPHSRRPFDRGEHRTPRHHRTRRADSGQCRRILPAVRATIAGNAPQPPALAFLRAAHVRDRHAVPRPCKAVFTRFASVRKSGKDSGKPSAPRLQHNQRKPSGDVATVQPFDRGEHQTPRRIPPRPCASLSGERGNRSTVRRLSAATVRATIAGNAPQPPALAFLRVGRVRARPAVPRPCKAVLRGLQASVNPARIPATVCNRGEDGTRQPFDRSGLSVYPASRGGSTVRRACQRFDRGDRGEHRTRRAGFVGNLSATIERRNPAQPSAPIRRQSIRQAATVCAGFRQASGNLSATIERGDRAPLVSRSPVPANIAATYPASRDGSTWRDRSTVPPDSPASLSARHIERAAPDSSPPCAPRPLKSRRKRPCKPSAVPPMSATV